MGDFDILWRVIRTLCTINVHNFGLQQPLYHLEKATDIVGLITLLSGRSTKYYDEPLR